MKAQELSQKYAMAVFNLALEKWLTALKVVQDRLIDDPLLAGRLADPQRTFTNRQKELDGIIPTDSDPIIRNFFYTLLKNGDIGLLGEVLAELQRISRGGPQVQTARVTTAIALSDSEKEELRQKLRQKYGGNLEFVFSVNPSIIGGVIVQVGDKVIDGSVSARLEALGNVLGVKN
ncbi:MAG: ATP synthase F1 subunit delta [Anaerolineae bacterium]|nr:ATP synthase F1 subunit delta [Anaerolineae bacterium]